LVLSDKDAPFLQGWAIVENTTEADWKDVGLTLVSGRPISFVMDLYEPLYVERPEVKPELYASLRPRTYEQDLAGADQDFERAALQKESGESLALNSVEDGERMRRRSGAGAKPGASAM